MITDLVSSHHTLRACDIICFEKRCELDTIKTPNKFDTHSVLKLFGTGERLSPIIFRNKNDKVPPKQSFGTSPAHSGEVLSSAPELINLYKIYAK